MAGSSPQPELDPIAAFAKQCGIRPDEEAEFGWLAEVGLQSPLPPRWTSHADATTGYVYYVDHDRQASSWENPLVPYLRRVVEIGRAYLKNRSEDFFEEQKGILWQQHKHDLDGWHGPFSDAEGRSYYVNSSAGVSSWQDPRVDAQYVFELESGLLATLAEVLPPPEASDAPGWGEPGAPWKNGDGAEVLTLDESGDASMFRTSSSFNASKPGLQRRLTQTMTNWSRNHNRDEHKSALEKMANTAQWVRSAQLDEVEVQRLQFSRKVADRRKRRQADRRSPGSKGSAATEERTLLHRFSSQSLGPMPEARLSPTSLSGRPAPSPLLENLQQTPDGPPMPAGSPKGSAAAGHTPPGSPRVDDGSSTPAGSPMPQAPSPMCIHPPTPNGSPMGAAGGLMLSPMPAPTCAPSTMPRHPMLPPESDQEAQVHKVDAAGTGVPSGMASYQALPKPPLSPSEQEAPVHAGSAGVSGEPQLPQQVAMHSPLAPSEEDSPCVPVVEDTDGGSRAPSLKAPTRLAPIAGTSTRAGKPRLFSSLAAASPGQQPSSPAASDTKSSAFSRHLKNLRESPSVTQ